MRTVHRISISDNMLTVFNYAARKLQENGKLKRLPSMPKLTKLLAEEMIIDGDVIIFRIPNGSPIKIKTRLRE